jgi:hypothetical protein
MSPSIVFVAALQSNQPQPRKNNDSHDDCFQPKDPNASALFRTTLAMQTVSQDNNLTSAITHNVLVDGGSQMNLIPKGIVEEMNARTASMCCVDLIYTSGSRRSK